MLPMLLWAVLALSVADTWAIGITPGRLEELKGKVQTAIDSTNDWRNANRPQHVIDSIWMTVKPEIEYELRRDADNPELNYLYGCYYYYGARDIKTARYRFVRAIQSNEHHFKARLEMIKIEDALKNYSSAICYANELLEYQPYDCELWQRKINLLRKSGNYAEAEAVKERMAHIFTDNDTIVRQYNNRWNAILKKSGMEVTVDSIVMAMDEAKGAVPCRDYTELMELYTAMGEYDKAIAAGLKCLNKATDIEANRYDITKRVANLMTTAGRYSQAQEFVADKYGLYNADKSYQNKLMEIIADDSRLNDPYEANARLYEKTGNHDALLYLTNTSISRGYYDDALGYIKKLYKDSTELLKHQYGLEIRMGHDQAAQSVLMKLYQRNPIDATLKDEFVDAFQRLSNSDVANGQWRDAEKNLQELYTLLKDSVEHEYWSSMMTRRITTFGHLGRWDDARNVFKEAASADTAHFNQFASAYEEMMVKRLRDYVEEERYDSALQVSMSLLSDVPSSTTAMRNCINLSQTLKEDTLFHQFSQIGYGYFSREPYYINKYAVSLQQQHQYENAFEMLDSCMSVKGYVNPLLVSTYSGITHQWVAEEIDSLKKLPHEVMYHKADSIRNCYQNIDKRIRHALLRDSLNKELLYDLGIVNERMHEWDSAHYYQSRYWNPSVAEQREFYQHVDYLEFRSFKERADVTYTHALYDTREGNLASTGHLYSIATVSYSHLAAKDTYTGQVSYKGIDGYHEGHDNESGGAGIELMGQWEHQFTDHLTGMASLSWSNRYFNKWGANASVSFAAKHGWTPSLRIGYRRSPKTYLYLSGYNSDDTENQELNLCLITPAVEKDWGRIRTTLTTDIAAIKSGVYYNVGLKGKLFFNEDNISSVSLITGFGTFPELSFFEQTALRNVSHTNSMVGFDVQILCSSHLYIGLSGNWNTCYDPYWNSEGILTNSYRNIYTICAQMHVAF